MRVLVADDDPLLLRRLQALLTSWGHEVELARDGLQAWGALQSEDAPRLALLDWMMTGMDGLEVIRKVRASAQPLPPYLIVLSARDSQLDVVRGLEAGADDYLKKPSSPAELRARIAVGARVLELQQCLSERVSQLQAALGEHGQVEAENRRLAAAIEQVAQGIVITDCEGTIQCVNPAFTELTGYSREEAIGRNPRILKSGQQDGEFYKDLWTTIRSGQVWNGALVNRRADGALYTEQMSIAPVRSSGGSITGFVAVKQDVTDQKGSGGGSGSRARSLADPAG